MSQPDNQAGEVKRAESGGGDQQSKEPFKNLTAMLDGLELPGFDAHAHLLALSGGERRRVKAMKKLQADIAGVEAEFYQKLFQLEIDMQAKYNQLYEKRRKLVTGEYEPTDAECTAELVHGIPDEELLADETMANKDDDAQEGQGKGDDDDKKPLVNGDVGDQTGDVRGVRHFWRTVLENSDELDEPPLCIEEHDNPILAHLVDIRCQMQLEPPGFTLVFEFSPNDYFTNAELTKHYSYRIAVDPDNPYTCDGPAIVATKGCKIDWKEGKNVTVKLMKKKQKQKSGGATRFVSKEVKAESFFNFFSPPDVEEGKENDLDDESKAALVRDFEFGETLRDHLIPQAVLYFTGEMPGDDGDMGEEGEEDDMDEDDDDESN